MTTLHPGQVVVEGMFVDPAVAPVTSANRIPAGQVAVSFQFDAVHGVAGLIEPGDKVNIMTSTTDGGQRTLFQNVDVLFIGARAAPAPGATTASTVAPVDPAGGSLITFAVPQLAAERIALAARQDGGLYLTLVPPDSQSAAVPPVNAGNLFTGGVTPYEG